MVLRAVLEEENIKSIRACLNQAREAIKKSAKEETDSHLQSALEAIDDVVYALDDVVYDDH